MKLKSYKIIIANVLFSFFLIQFFSCSSITSIYKFEGTLSDKKTKSKYSDLTVYIPINWFIAEDNLFNTDIWLVKNDYSASIKFSKINVSYDSSIVIDSNYLDKLISMEMDLIKFEIGKSFKGFSNKEKFEMNGKTFSAFEFVDKNNYPTRIVLFDYNNIFYESIATSHNIYDYKEVFSHQNLLLKSIQ